MLSTPLLLAILSSSGALIYLSIRLIQTQRERDRLKQDLRRYESLTSKEETEKQLDSNIQLKQSERDELETKIKILKSRIGEIEAKEYLLSIDDYEPKYDFVSSKDYLQRIQQNKLRQKEMRDKKQAFICDTHRQWQLGADKRKGKKLIDNILKVIELAFEEQCNYAIKQVSYSNVSRLKQKLQKTFNIINKCLQEIDCHISEKYLQLKLEELDLEYECEEKKQEEKERAKELKKQKKEREEVEKAHQEVEEAEEKEKNHRQELDKVQQEMKQLAEAEVEKRKQLELHVQQLEKQISEDQSDKENAISRSQRIKSGHIYVVSNIGSLGRGIYRIFMTQNSTPDAFVKSMKPYVPFPFDIHFKIFVEDASEAIQYLHQYFNDKRVNIVNERRDFFKVELSEINQVIQEMDRETGALRILSFEKTPQAYEYRKTQAAERKKSNDITTNEIA